MPKNKHANVKHLGWEFIKLQIAGNIPFWGTYLMNAFLDQIIGLSTFYSLFISTVLANTLFFVVDDKWVFKREKGHRKTSTKVVRFVIFMVFSALLTFNVTWLLYSVLGISPYIGQFISAGLSITWTFVGLRFWVFAPVKKSHRRRKNRQHKKRNIAVSQS